MLAQESTRPVSSKPDSNATFKVLQKIPVIGFLGKIGKEMHTSAILLAAISPEKEDASHAKMQTVSCTSFRPH